MKTALIIAFFLIGLLKLHAQEIQTASGGEATGIGGTVSYSVGQVVFTSIGSNSEITQGVQQPYEIYITTGLDQNSINLELNVYPNPTTNYLTLKVDGEKLENLYYQLINSQGKIIHNNKINSNSTIINFADQPKAIYLLTITKNNNTIKTYKIIKN